MANRRVLACSLVWVLVCIHFVNSHDAQMNMKETDQKDLPAQDHVNPPSQSDTQADQKDLPAQYHDKQTPQGDTNTDSKDQADLGNTQPKQTQETKQHSTFSEQEAVLAAQKQWEESQGRLHKEPQQEEEDIGIYEQKSGHVPEEDRKIGDAEVYSIAEPHEEDVDEIAQKSEGDVGKQQEQEERLQKEESNVNVVEVASQTLQGSETYGNGDETDQKEPATNEQQGRDDHFEPNKDKEAGTFIDVEYPIPQNINQIKIKDIDTDSGEPVAQPVDHGFPNPVDYNKIDIERIDRVLRKKPSDNERETSIIYKPDQFGQMKMEVYKQTRLENGQVETEYEEHYETIHELVEHRDEVQEFERKVKSGEIKVNSDGIIDDAAATVESGDEDDGAPEIKMAHLGRTDPAPVSDDIQEELEMTEEERQGETLLGQLM